MSYIDSELDEHASDDANDADDDDDGYYYHYVYPWPKVYWIVSVCSLLEVERCHAAQR